ncbi:MAG: phosphate ABC transporter permease subunit PstC [Alphaproteobacteria bacterium]|nr:phosphate ABC transporter permease subunit PstC [Alphaproteobacteria bacterium]
MSLIIILALVGLVMVGYWTGRSRAYVVCGNQPHTLHSLPSYYGAFVALAIGIPALVMFALWLIIQPQIVEAVVLGGLPQEIQDLPDDRLGLILNDIYNIASGNIASIDPDPAVVVAGERYASLMTTGSYLMTAAVIAVALIGLVIARSRIATDMRARNTVERTIDVLLLIASMIAIMTTIGIVLSLIFETIRFFGKVPFFEFLFGTEWSPQIALRADQAGSSGAFGAIPIFAGTMLITFIAMCVAVPIGLFAAIYMAEYAGKRFRAWAKPVLEILAGIPTVVYGFFAALTVAPFFRDGGDLIGIAISSESALAAGVVMGIMIIPFVSSLSDDVINAVPQSLRDGAYALGATRSETVRQVILPAALPGVVGAVLLAISRAIGETMIVVMAAGLAANLTANPLEAVTTVTVQIVTLLVGDQEFDSAKTLAAFALGLVLFVVTLCLNIIALHVVRKYREQYD